MSVRNAGLVGHIARSEDQRGFLAVQTRELPLKLDQRVIVAGNVARATGASAHAGRGFDHGADHLRVLAHAKVVVRASDHDWARAVRRMPGCVRETTRDALEIRKHAGAAFRVQPGKRRGKEMIIAHGRDLQDVLKDWEFPLCRCKDSPRPFDQVRLPSTL